MADGKGGASTKAPPPADGKGSAAPKPAKAPPADGKNGSRPASAEQSPRQAAPPARRRPQPAPEPKPRVPTVGERTMLAVEAQTRELQRLRVLLEKRERAAEPTPDYAAGGLDQRMTWDGGNATHDRSLKWLAFLKAFPAFMAQMTRIPEDFWSREAEKEEGVEVVMAVVRCPCGTHTVVEVGDSAECSGTQKSGAPCKRFYLYLVDRVYVANSPKTRLAPWETIVDDYRTHQSDRSDS